MTVSPIRDKSLNSKRIKTKHQAIRPVVCTTDKNFSGLTDQEIPSWESGSTNLDPGLLTQSISFQKINGALYFFISLK